MKKDDILDAMSGIKDEYINEAVPGAARRKSSVWAKAGVIAACLCLFAAVGFLIPYGMNKPAVKPPVDTDTVGSGVETTAPAANETTGMVEDSTAPVESDTPDTEDMATTEDSTTAPQTVEKDPPEIVEKAIGGASGCSAHPHGYHSFSEGLVEYVGKDVFEEWYKSSYNYDSKPDKKYPRGECYDFEVASIKTFIDDFDIPRAVFEEYFDEEEFLQYLNYYKPEREEIIDALYSCTEEEADDYFNSLICENTIGWLRAFMSSGEMYAYRCGLHHYNYHAYGLPYSVEGLDEAEALSEFRQWENQLTEEWLAELSRDYWKLEEAIMCRTPYNIKAHIDHYDISKEMFLEINTFTADPYDTDFLYSSTDEAISNYFKRGPYYDESLGIHYNENGRSNFNKLWNAVYDECATVLYNIGIDGAISMIERIYVSKIPRNTLEEMIVSVNGDGTGDAYNYDLDLVYGEGTDGTDALPLDSIKDLIIDTYRSYGVSMYLKYVGGDSSRINFGKYVVKKCYGIENDTYDEAVFESDIYPLYRLDEMFCRVGRYAE
ncbi:MAG: hypothetical protein IJO81_02755 [Clostridia bacterium]|nr:hypothetical protein [Clostridia bacterium]